MIEKLLAPVLDVAGKAIVKSGTATVKAIVEHLTKHGTKYLIGGGAAVASGVAYAAGESVGHSKGKKKGTSEQAARDEKKMQQLHEQHEKDRKCWNKQKQAYEDLLDESEKNF